ncbi:MAG TPA: fumarylacetoacetate hydrolase family protein [Chloroflexota bacterium]|jgi:2-keto-4-pentenoate hydratase/2-oxohepta-3-ene-1,7-dioic acid hydratase in catechol pathway
MKLVTFAVVAPAGRVSRLGALLDGDEHGRIVDLTAAYAAYLAAETDEPTPRELAALRTPPDMIGWLRGAHKAREAAEQAVAYARRRLEADTSPLGLDDARLVYARADVRLLAPLPRPRTIRDFSIYEEHMSRAKSIPKKRPAWYRWPPYYKGNPDAVVGPEDPIPYPYYTQKLDLEPEIGIVVGREGRNLSYDAARAAIAGYTIFIDCSARDGYEREPFGPTKRKDFCNVLGPCLVTADEVDEGNLAVRVSVDGETWFEGNTGHLRSFRPEHLVAYASDNETLHPGDLLGTGTVGLGCSMDLARWPQVGQTFTVAVAGLGTLSHRIVAGERGVDYTLRGMDGLLRPPEAEA